MYSIGTSFSTRRIRLGDKPGLEVGPLTQPGTTSEHTANLSSFHLPFPIREMFGQDEGYYIYQKQDAPAGQE
jgi:hypothetical protein